MPPVFVPANTREFGEYKYTLLVFLFQSLDGDIAIGQENVLSIRQKGGYSREETIVYRFEGVLSHPFQ